jgi:hypothetical protein
MTMNKLSSTKVAEVLAQVPIALRAQQQEIAELKEKVAGFEKQARATKIASAMQTKNLSPDTSYEEKIAALMDRDDLDVYEKAIDLSAPQIKLAALSDHHGNSANAEDAFVAALMD